MYLSASACLILVSVASLTDAQFKCKISADLKAELHSYQPVVDQIVAAVINGPKSGAFYDDLTEYVDKFGYRLSGTENLENAIDDVMERETKAGLKVSTQNVTVNSWTRGEESAEIRSPRRQKISILGLGTASNMTEEGVTASVVLVSSFQELAVKGAKVSGKLVLFNPPFTSDSYSEVRNLRRYGPSNASALGAVAALVKSETTFSISSPHTGVTEFVDPNLRIPAAALALEHVHYIERLITKGYDVKVNLKMSAQNNADTISRNVIGDIVGRSKPEEYVVISGHIDSWDVGQGALDDADGAFLAWRSLALINELGLPPPARTIRSILWTDEEFGVIGATAYRREREAEVRNWTVAFESDEGVYKSKGISFNGSDEAACIMQEIVSLFGAVNATVLNRHIEVGLGSDDIQAFEDFNIPLGQPYSEPNNYLTFHHTEGDWIDVLKSEDLDQNLAIFASTTYILANLSVALPKVMPSSTSTGLTTNCCKPKCQ